MIFQFRDRLKCSDESLYTGDVVLQVDCLVELIHVYTGNDMPLVFPETSVSCRGWANSRPRRPIQDDYLIVLKDFAVIQILELFVIRFYKCNLKY